ncbi:MAG: hybrid sensor histidine kinase/response regulator [Spirochaetota bacterium]|nr:hybrid sensor histidine kinase/response regulator [Spirochaetota bacterium]
MSQTETNKGSILIVDDTPKNIQVLGSVLENEGYEVSLSTNGKMAIEAANKILPDLILLDVVMPEMDGYEACAKLKESSLTQSIPVIFLTARTEPDDIVKGFQSGGVDYITKPFNIPELLARVETQIRLKNSLEKIESISREQQELLHILCHDLMNPIAYMLGSLDLLERNPEQFPQFAGDMKSAMLNSKEIIDLVRTLRAYEEKKLSFELEKLSLFDIISDSLLIVRDLLKRKKIQLLFDVQKDIIIWAERISLVNSVINNVLTNAIKFSFEQGQIEIKATENKDGTILIVEDQGIGMPATILNSLFDMSKPTNRAGTQGEQGTGFGMPLVKKFMDAYGGAIEIESNEKQEGKSWHGTRIILKFKKAD